MLAVDRTCRDCMKSAAAALLVCMYLHETVLDRLQKRDFDVIGVGKIGDIFAMQGIEKSHPSHSNTEGMEITRRIAAEDFCGLCFTNLVDFDMHYGHRQDAMGYARALNEFDAWLGDFLPCMQKDDVLIITADHGCDPSDDSTDHTREFVPFLMIGDTVTPKNLGTVHGFDFVGETVYNYLTE